MSQARLTEAQNDAITEAAAQWCMRLHEPDCTRQEREAFAVWLNANPLHALEYEAMLEIWGVSEHLARPAPAAARGVALPSATRRRTWQRFAVAAAVTLLALPVAAYSGWQLGWVPNAHERYSADASARTVTLPDGSQVELNLGSQLTFSNYKDQRRVTLGKGEAFFKSATMRRTHFWCRRQKVRFASQVPSSMCGCTKIRCGSRCSKARCWSPATSA